MKNYLKPFNLFLLFAGVIVLLSLVSYTSADLFYPHHNIHNLMGLVGVKISYFLLSNFGLPAFFVPIFLLLSTVSYSISSAKFVRSVIFAFLFIVLSDVVLYAVVGNNRAFFYGHGYFIYGLGGYEFGPTVKYVLGRVGVYVVVLLFALVSLYYSLREPILFAASYLSRFLSVNREKKDDRRVRIVKRAKASKASQVKPASGGGAVRTANDNEVKIETSRDVDKPQAPEVVSETVEKNVSTEETEQKPSIDKEYLDKKQDETAEPVPEEKEESGYTFPSLELLDEPIHIETGLAEDEIYKSARTLEEKLRNFGVEGRVVNVRPGPVITMYEFKPKSGIKISKIANLYNDLAMAMRAMSVRIVAPIPGKAVVGIEISNQKRQTVYMREVLASKNFVNSHSKLTLALGKDIVGNSFVTDLSKMPHLLIAGATGSGKSVAMNVMIVSILYKAAPDEVKFVMIDPKRLELSIYEGIPHMLMPVVVDPREASGSLAALISEMETRYTLMSEVGVRNIDGFNAKAKRGLIDYPPMPYIVVVIDELADLMMVAGKKVEAYIARLAQMARAAGIHMIVATQRPSVDVVTGLIKANFPARISFKLASKADSRTILDMQGAEALLGKGDMLFMQPGSSSLIRVHGAFISDDEIKNVTDFVKSQGSPEYNEELINATKEASGIKDEDDIEVDEMFDEAVKIIMEGGSPTISYIQRRLKIGYNRAARIVEQMEKKGILSKPDDRGKREVLI